MRSTILLFGAVTLLAVVGWFYFQEGLVAGGGNRIAIDGDDIGGIVMGPNGPEAGVWVIAETNDLPTRFVRSVVTDDDGRYVIPDLPDAIYLVWARGYGLLDSTKIQAAPGDQVHLASEVAPDEKSAAEIYPAMYWGALLNVPGADEFPGTGDAGNGISPDIQSQEHWVYRLKATGCYSCHQFGNEATRVIPAMFDEYEDSMEAWTRRIQSGMPGLRMVEGISGFGPRRPLEEFADWTDRIEAGEVPFEKPPRPQGVERNVVVTQWDFAEPHLYMHDVISTDRRDPTVNGYGKLYGSAEVSTDLVPILDPMNNIATTVAMPVADPDMPVAHGDPVIAPSPYWGDQVIWDSRTNNHNPMMDHRGRAWFAARAKTRENPDFCREGSNHPSAQLRPMNESGRDVTMYDPATDEWDLIPTCFGTHHLVFTEDETQTMWFSGGGGQIGWLKTTLYEETGDYAGAQGWTDFVLDTNGNGVRDPNPVGHNDPLDPMRDKILDYNNYSVSISPVDGSIWGAYREFPGGFLRLIPGDNPPETAIGQYYEIPRDADGTPSGPHSMRGADIDRNGVMWAGLQSGHVASFDVRKCTGPLNGPEATGQHCPEGWAFYQLPGPQYKNMQDVPGSAEASYYTWVDQFNTLGLGEDVPVVIGNASDSLHALVDGEVVTMRVPYPLGFHAKGLDGRIDDINAGWKGRGLWSTSGNRTPFHMETGKGTRPKVYHFQLRETPLDH
jgi:hypothetical protein